MPSGDDWFAGVADEFAKDPATQKAQEGHRRAEARLRQMKAEAELRRRANPARAARAAEGFATGGVIASGSGSWTADVTTSSNIAPRPRTVSPEEALEIIKLTVQSTDDPFMAAGDWISRVTNELSQIARDAEAKER